MLVLDGIGEIFMWTRTSVIKDGVVKGLESRNSNETNLIESSSSCKAFLGSVLSFLIRLL